VPAGAQVVDLGAGPGGVAAELVHKGCQVAVVDRESPTVRNEGVQVYVHDLDDPLKVDLRSHDYLLLLDVLEHLRDPERFLDDLRSQFDHRPRHLVLSVPNVAFVAQRLMLLFGEFNYGKRGILDRDHVRLFTFRSLDQILRDAGWRIRRVRGVPAPFPKAFGEGPLAQLALAVNQLLIRLWPTIFSYQIFVEADSTPDIAFLLEDAERSRLTAQTKPPAKRA
jgi:hypothetical protein